jgi:hypothetical protein
MSSRLLECDNYRSRWVYVEVRAAPCSHHANFEVPPKSVQRRIHLTFNSFISPGRVYVFAFISPGRVYVFGFNQKPKSFAVGPAGKAAFFLSFAP